MNAVNERFNRTIQEEFVDYEENPSGDDPSAFNLLCWISPDIA